MKTAAVWVGLLSSAAYIADSDAAHKVGQAIVHRVKKVARAVHKPKQGKKP